MTESQKSVPVVKYYALKREGSEGKLEGSV
jgi:hypothetical protein